MTTALHTKKKQKKTTNDNGVPAKKKKRPWRQSVRRKARKARLAAERKDRGETQLECPKQTNDVDSSTSKKKKKNSKKKKRSIEGTNDVLKVSNPITTAKVYTNGEKLQASRFRYLNEKMYTSTSAEAEQLFREDPEAFQAYHRGYSVQVSKWPTNPLDVIIKDLETLSDGSVIADLGCGEAKLAEKLESKYKIYSFDLVAPNDRVTACNITKLPLDTASVNVAVFCLSLMGTNLSDYIREAHRILTKGGKMKIAEVSSRFRSVKSFIFALEKMGFQLKRKKELASYFTLLTLEKMGKITEKRPKGLILNPCLYKKR